MRVGLRTTKILTRRLSAAWLPLALLCSLPVVLGGQTVRGTVLDLADQRVTGVVVMLLDSSERIVAQTLTNDRGEYSVRAPAPGVYRLRALRIGFRPVISRELTLEPGAVAEEQLLLDGGAVSLDAVRVSGQNVCGRRAVGGSTAVFSAWEQAMGSIAATALTSDARGLTATTMQVDRVLESSGRRIKSQEASARTDQVSRPWRSLPPEVLRELGYAERDADGSTTYHAPGLDVLSSSAFLEDHCLRLLPSRDTSEVGVAFEPNSMRWRKAEIRGTLWMARATAELRRLEFSYTNVPDAPKVAEGIAGGTMRFARLRTGAIVISSWEIRMPQLEKISPRSVAIHVSEILTTGGELVVIRQGSDTLFRRPTLVVQGMVEDSVSGQALVGARVELVGTPVSVITTAAGAFTLNDVLPGEYTLAVRTPSLDSIRASSQSSVVVVEGMSALRLRVPTAMQLVASFCGRALTGVAGRGLGAVLGSVRHLGDTAAVAGVRVVGEWTEVGLRGNSGGVAQDGRRLEVRTDANGSFRLCGVPTEALLTLRALPTAGRAEPVALRLSADERFATTVLVIDPVGAEPRP